MYYSSRTFEVPVAYKLNVDDKDIKIRDNFKIILGFRGKSLNSDGTLADSESVDMFIKNVIGNNFLDEIMDDNPTMENIARWIYEQIIPCYKVEIISSFGYCVSFVEDD